MAEELYKLTVSLESYRNDALDAALKRLRELCDEHELANDKVTAKAVIKTSDYDAVIAVRAQLELYLRHTKVRGVDGRVLLDEPIVRPEPIEPVATPMDQLWSEGGAEDDESRVLIPPDPDMVIEAADAVISDE